MSNAASTPEFKKILESLYSSGQYTSSGDVLREAWKEYKSRHGQLGPSGSVQRKRYAMRKTAMGMNPRQQIGSRRHKNPIAVYNPTKKRKKRKPRTHGLMARAMAPFRNPRLTKLPATNIEIRYQRTGGEYRGKWFKHTFKSTASLFGMPDGSLLLKSSGRKLWGTI